MSNSNSLRNHLYRKISFELFDLGRKVGSLFDGIIDMFSAFSVRFGWVSHFGAINLRLLSSLMITDSWSPFSNTTRNCTAVVSSIVSTYPQSPSSKIVSKDQTHKPNQSRSFFRYQLVFEPLRLSNFCNVCTDQFLPYSVGTSTLFPPHSLGHQESVLDHLFPSKRSKPYILENHPLRCLLLRMTGYKSS